MLQQQDHPFSDSEDGEHDEGLPSASRSELSKLLLELHDDLDDNATISPDSEVENSTGRLEIEEFSSDEGNTFDPAPTDDSDTRWKSVLEESRMSWRQTPTIPESFLKRVSEFAKKCNITQVNRDFAVLEETRLQWGAQELNRITNSGGGDGREGEGRLAGISTYTKSRRVAKHLVPLAIGEVDGEKDWEPRNTSSRSSSGAPRSATTPAQPPAHLYAPRESIAYTVRRSVPMFSVTKRVFAEINRRVPSASPTSLLDFGAGPGTAIWSADAVWGDTLGLSAGRFTMVDHSPAMQEIAQMLLQSASPELVSIQPTTSSDIMAALRQQGPDVRFRETLRDLFSPRGERRIDGLSRDGNNEHDIVLASNTMSELENDEKRRAAAHLLWRCTAPGGFFVVVERGNRWGALVCEDVRKTILEASTAATVVAPCTHAHACPLSVLGRNDDSEGEGNDATRRDGIGKAERSWCHFSVRTGDEDIRRIVKNRRGHSRPSHDKFCYVVMQKSSGEQEDSTTRSVLPTHPIEGHDWSRIVRPPIRRKRHVIIDVCGADGDFERRVYGKTRFKEHGIYRAARKSEWGALWGVSS